MVQASTPNTGANSGRRCNLLSTGCITQATWKFGLPRPSACSRHTASYALWEGSDVDIDDRIQAARQSVERDQSLANFLTQQFPPQPLIARRHYFQTGTLRYFDGCCADREGLQGDLFHGALTAE